MKKVLAMVVIATAFGLAGCSMSGTSASPKDVAQQYVNDIEQANFEAAAGLYQNSTPSDLKDLEQLKNTSQWTAIADLFKHSKIILGDEHINGNAATVDATVTSPNFGQVMAKVLGNTLADAFSNGLSSNSPSSAANDAAAELDKALNDPSIPTETSKAEINLTKTSDGWKISNNNSSLADAITGGASTMFSSLNSSANESQGTSNDVPLGMNPPANNAPSNTMPSNTVASIPPAPSDATTLQSLIPLMTTWMNTAEEIRSETNSNLMAFNNLPSDDYGTSAFFSDFDAVQSEYQTLTRLTQYLNADTSKLVNFVATHHFSHDQNTIVDFKARAASVSEDFVSGTQQIQKELAGEISLVQQFKAGSTNPSVPYWTFDQWNFIANDETTNWPQLMIDYAEITASGSN